MGPAQPFLEAELGVHSLCVPVLSWVLHRHPYTRSSRSPIPQMRQLRPIDPLHMPSLSPTTLNRGASGQTQAWVWGVQGGATYPIGRLEAPVVRDVFAEGVPAVHRLPVHAVVAILLHHALGLLLERLHGRVLPPGPEVPVLVVLSACGVRGERQVRRRRDTARAPCCSRASPQGEISQPRVRPSTPSTAEMRPGWVLKDLNESAGLGWGGGWRNVTRLRTRTFKVSVELDSPSRLVKGL